MRGFNIPGIDASQDSFRMAPREVSRMSRHFRLSQNPPFRERPMIETLTHQLGEAERRIQAAQRIQPHHTDFTAYVEF